MSRKAATAITVNLTDTGRLQKLRLIVSYESAIRGLSQGQVFAELIMDAVDLEHYPAEVKDLLEELNDEMEIAAIERAVAAA